MEALAWSALKTKIPALGANKKPRWLTAFVFATKAFIWTKPVKNVIPPALPATTNADVSPVLQDTFWQTLNA